VSFTKARSWPGSVRSTCAASGAKTISNVISG
jgi:hypothetical protein